MLIKNDFFLNNFHNFLLYDFQNTGSEVNDQDLNFSVIKFISDLLTQNYCIISFRFKASVIVLLNMPLELF